MDSTRAQTRSARRGRRLTAATLAAVVVVALAGRAAVADGPITIDPPAGSTGTPYRVTVSCADEPTLYGRPVTESGPPGTLVPLSIVAAGSGTWTYDAEAGAYDDTYGAVCDDEVANARFDVDVPRLFLGPVPETPFPMGDPTTIEGTDCPAGTTVAIRVTASGEETDLTATPGDRGDWSAPLPLTYGVAPFTVDATCGSVTYDTLRVVGPDEPTPPQPTVPVEPAPPSPAAPATPALPTPGQAGYTG